MNRQTDKIHTKMQKTLIQIEKIEHKMIILSQKRTTPSLLISISLLPTCYFSVISKWKNHEAGTARRQTLSAPAKVGRGGAQD